MPPCYYHEPSYRLAVAVVVGVVVLALLIMAFVRWVVRKRFRYSKETNEAISGAVQAIGVFYGITVGLIAVDVWDSHSNAREIVSREAISMYQLHYILRSLPVPRRDSLVHDYRVCIVDTVWPKLEEGGHADSLDWGPLRGIRRELFSIVVNPESLAQAVRLEAAIDKFGELEESRRLRIAAASTRLSPIMWWIIAIGAVISIGVACLYKIKDPWIHGTIIVLMAAFIGLVVFFIMINDRAFCGGNRVRESVYREQYLRPIEEYWITSARWLGDPTPKSFPRATEVYELPHKGWVHVEVRDDQGKVATLADETRLGGRHRVRWDGRDSLRAKLPAGVYSLHLGFGESKKSFKFVDSVLVSLE